MDYSLITQSLGAGVQSSTITEMIVEGELPPVDAVIFADTGDEPDYVYEQADYLKGRLNTIDIPLVVVSAGDMVEDLYGGGRLAAMPFFTKSKKKIEGFGRSAEVFSIARLRRQCTREYKIEPIEKWIKTELLRRGLAKQNKRGAITVKRGVKVQSWLGISWDEMSRMKPAKNKWIDHTWPLVDLRMSRHDCIEWLKSKGLPVPKKSSCKRCPFHDKAYYRDMRESSPGDWQEIVLFDKDLRNGTLALTASVKADIYMARECVPLDEIDLSNEQDNGQMDMCDEGFCFV